MPEVASAKRRALAVLVLGLGAIAATVAAAAAAGRLSATEGSAGRRLSGAKDCTVIEDKKQCKKLKKKKEKICVWTRGSCAPKCALETKKGKCRKTPGCEWTRGACVAETAETAPKNTPNVVLFFGDDLGWADVGYNGGNFPTPNIDKLADEGVNMRGMYGTPQCTPTRSAVLTGRYPHRIGLQAWTTILPFSDAAIPHDVPTLAEELKGAGYRTYAAGKWHLGSASESDCPSGRGFDVHYGSLGGGVHYTQRSIALGDKASFGSPYSFSAISMTDASGEWVDMEAMLDIFYGNETGVRCVTEDYEIGYHEDKLLEYAETWIAESVDAAEPFFLYYSPWLVHTPDHLVTDHSTLDDTATEHCASNDREMLCTMVAKLDESVGKVRGYLEDNGVDGDTLFWFLSDNGGVQPNRNIAGESSNFPYRGGKTTHFEGGIKLQSLVYAPSLIKANMMASTRDDMFRHIDILPTILDAVGIEPSGTVDGQSVLKTIKNSAVKTGITSHEANVHVGRNAIFSNKMTDHDLADRYPYSALIEWPHKIIFGSPSSLFIRTDLEYANGWVYMDETNHWTMNTTADEAEYTPLRIYDLENDPNETAMLNARTMDRELGSGRYKALRDDLVELMHIASLKSVPEQHGTPSVSAVARLLDKSADNRNFNFCYEPWQAKTSQRKTGRTIEQYLSTDVLGVCPVSVPVNTLEAIQENSWHVPSAFVELGAKNGTEGVTFPWFDCNS